MVFDPCWTEAVTVVLGKIKALMQVQYIYMYMHMYNVIYMQHLKQGMVKSRQVLIKPYAFEG